MNNNRKWVDCDINKLNECLKKRNLSLREASVELGHHETFLHHAKYSKQINAAASILLEVKYGIKPEDYAFEEAPKEEPIEESKETVVYDKLYKTIYQAVYHAMEDVLNK